MTKIFNKILICIIFFLVLGIICKHDNKYRELIKYRLYEDNFSFSVFEDYYNKYLGDIIPIEGLFSDNIKAVFNEDLVYNLEFNSKNEQNLINKGLAHFLYVP